MSTQNEVEVTQDEARRIAVRAQLLDGSAKNVLDTVRRLGSLQIDPISTVAPPQHLVLWSRLGSTYDRAQLDRLLWRDKKLFEWAAFIYPMDDYPLIRARMLRPRTGKYAHERHGNAFLKTNARFRRYILRELERRGPLLSRELEDRSRANRPRGVWWGNRDVMLMLELLHSRGELAVVGRRGKQRLWDLAERWYPDVEAAPLEDAEKLLADRRARAQGVRYESGRWLAHPKVRDGPVPNHVTLLSPFDRLIYDRERAEALWEFRYRLEMYVPKAKREYGYYVLPLLVGAHVVGRAEPRFDPKAKTLELLGAWGETSRLDEALAELGAFLGAERLARGPRG